MLSFVQRLVSLKLKPDSIIKGFALPIALVNPEVRASFVALLGEDGTNFCTLNG